MSPSRVAFLFILLGATGCAQPPTPVSPPSAPESLEAFTAAAARSPGGDRRAGRGHRAGAGRWRGVGRGDRPGRSRPAHAGDGRHAFPRRLHQQDVRGDGAGAAIRRRRDGHRGAGLRARAERDHRQSVQRSGHGAEPAAAHRRLRRHALQRALQPDRPARPAAARGAGAQSRLTPRALATGNAHVVFEPGLRRGRRGPRAGDRPALRRRHPRAHLHAAWHEHQQFRADARRRSRLWHVATTAGLARQSRSRRSISGRPATCTPRRPSWAASFRCSSTGAKPPTSW